MKNQLMDLPQSIGDLVALKDLDLSENALEALPEEVGNLHSCTQLDLSGNRLSSIPDSVGMCFLRTVRTTGACRAFGQARTPGALALRPQSC